MAACARAGTPSTTAAAEMAQAGDQVARGGKLFGDHCAKCHGDAGQGSDKAPPVVGAGALPLDPRPGSKRKVQFHTAKDVGVFVMKSMPADDPGSLKPDEYFAILAFDLKANGVDVTGKTIDADAAEKIVLH
ncbi:MAG TPA: c-type cytochrome [Haliangiales bacterium]|nr:c-type cytochrome [Haliangiales bacterium]